MRTRFSGWRIAAFATVVLGLTGPGQTIGVSVFIDHFADDLELSKNAIAGGYAIGTLTGSPVESTAAVPCYWRYYFRVPDEAIHSKTPIF